LEQPSTSCNVTAGLDFAHRTPPQEPNHTQVGDTNKVLDLKTDAEIQDNNALSDVLAGDTNEFRDSLIIQAPENTTSSGQAANANKILHLELDAQLQAMASSLDSIYPSGGKVEATGTDVKLGTQSRVHSLPKDSSAGGTNTELDPKLDVQSPLGSLDLGLQVEE
jgi:hypothetical protein